MDDLADFVVRFGGMVGRMAMAFPTPEPELLGGHPVLRHREKSNALAAVLKCVKLVSTLNGAAVLLRHGCVQEVAILCRVAHECCTDIAVLSGATEEDHERLQQILEEFYREEAAEPERLLATQAKRASVPRQKVIAALARTMQHVSNPSDTQSIFLAIERVLSGYVHSAYPHIMELYGGPERGYHMTGMLDTPRMDEWSPQVVGYLYRAMTITRAVASWLGRKAIEADVAAIRAEFETRYECGPDRSLAEQLAAIKR